MNLQFGRSESYAIQCLEILLFSKLPYIGRFACKLAIDEPLSFEKIMKNNARK